MSHSLHQTVKLPIWKTRQENDKISLHFVLTTYQVLHFFRDNICEVTKHNAPSCKTTFFREGLFGVKEINNSYDTYSKFGTKMSKYDSLYKFKWILVYVLISSICIELDPFHLTKLHFSYPSPKNLSWNWVGKTLQYLLTGVRLLQSELYLTPPKHT